MSVVIGVDLGKAGAVAAVSSIGEGGVAPDVDVMPVVTSPRGRPQYDLTTLRMWLAERWGRPRLVVYEDLHALPPRLGGSAANYQRGLGRGLLEGLLSGLQIPGLAVAPQTWQKVMLAGVPGDDTKQRSVIAAQRIFPGQSLRRSIRSRKPDDGFADALLLAEYGRRVVAR